MGSIMMTFVDHYPDYILRSVCLDNDSLFPDEAFSMAIHDAAEILGITPYHCSRLLISRSGIIWKLDDKVKKTVSGFPLTATYS